jgi:UDPglucose 6-dehydrogenase
MPILRARALGARRAEVAAGRLRFEDDDAEAIADAAVVFICVETPARASGEANLLAIERATRWIAPRLSGPVVVVEKSTVPAGTAQQLRKVLVHERPDLIDHLDVVSNPEFLREGQGVEDTLRPRES